MSDIKDKYFSCAFALQDYKVLIKRLTDQGGIVDITTTQDTDFVVTKDWAEPDYSLQLAKSRRLGTSKITMDELKEMLEKDETRYFRISNKVFVLTGTMWEHRSHITTRILAQGGIVHPRVTKETDYVIVGDSKSTTIKYKQGVDKHSSLINHLKFKDNLEDIEMGSHPYNRDGTMWRTLHLDSQTVNIGNIVAVKSNGLYKIIDSELYNHNGNAFGIVKDFVRGKAGISVLGVINMPDAVRATNLVPENKEDKPKRKLTKEAKSKITNTLDKTKNEFDEFDKLFK